MVKGFLHVDIGVVANDYKASNGLGNTGVWYGAVGDQTMALLQGENWLGELNTDDSVYIDSSGVTITAGNRSGKTIDSSGHLIQNKSSGKKKGKLVRIIE